MKVFNFVDTSQQNSQYPLCQTEFIWYYLIKTQLSHKLQLCVRLGSLRASFDGIYFQSIHPLIRTSQVSLSSNPDADFRYSTIFTQIGIYKGRVFAIKKVHKKSIDMTREMKKELKMVGSLFLIVALYISLSLHKILFDKKTLWIFDLNSFQEFQSREALHVGETRR